MVRHLRAATQKAKQWDGREHRPGDGVFLAAPQGPVEPRSRGAEVAGRRVGVQGLPFSPPIPPPTTQGVRLLFKTRGGVRSDPPPPRGGGVKSLPRGV